ncbi:IS200/IS605 family element transposase accessory protein TnpB [Candidatus Woesearchaeota archaeon]|nr:IS200/IS605 family element transposase accessory protein TnpB [Candidatus Woesearchaeota archaeon]
MRDFTVFEQKEYSKTYLFKVLYNQSGFKLIQTGKRLNKIKLSKIGEIKIKSHREIKGKIKQITIKKENSGRWFAIITAEEINKPKIKLNINKAVGIDLGLINIIHDSENNIIKNPRHLINNEIKLKKLQRVLSKKKKGSKNREKSRIKLAKQHEKITNLRKDFLHKISSYYIKNYDLIVIEGLRIKNMVKRHLSKSINDASWNKLRQLLTYKAENAGKLLIKVNPYGTTQRCSNCNSLVKKELGDREHKCSNCGLDISRDYNSALKIKNKMLKQLKVRQELSDLKPVEMPLAAEHKNPGSYYLPKKESTSQALMKQEAQERLSSDAQPFIRLSSSQIVL